MAKVSAAVRVETISAWSGCHAARCGLAPAASERLLQIKLTRYVFRHKSFTRCLKHTSVFNVLTHDYHLEGRVVSSAEP